MKRALIVVVIVVCSLSAAPPAQVQQPGAAPAPAPGAAAPAAPASELTINDLRGQAYTGPRVETPRGLDGKPDLSGYWRPLREAGKISRDRYARLAAAVKAILGYAIQRGGTTLRDFISIALSRS